MFRLALRNLLRNKRRTIITGMAISGGLMLLMTGNNLNHGTYLTLLKQGISTVAGHVVVQGEGWQADPDPIDHRVDDAQTAVDRLQSAFPDATVLQRTFVGGLLNSPNNSVGIAVTGLQAGKEERVSDWHQKVVEGKWLEEGDTRGIVLGVELARSLQVGIGKKVVLMGQGKEEVSSRLFRVRGLFRSGAAQADGFMAFTSVEALQDFLGEPGAASQVSLHLPDPLTSDEALERSKELFADTKGLEVLGWKEALAELYQFTVLDRATNNKMMFFIGLLVALGILNTVLMSVMERMREFGVMLALGLPPGKLRQLIMLEGLILGVVASLIGAAAASGITNYLVESGIDYSEMMGESMELAGVAISTHIYAGWDPKSMMIYSVIAVLISVLATVYPAWKAGKLQPVESMKHV
jgi:ABC-type lipoprotein release transport system permease subunit